MGLLALFGGFFAFVLILQQPTVARLLPLFGIVLFGYFVFVAVQFFKGNLGSGLNKELDDLDNSVFLHENLKEDPTRPKRKQPSN